MRRIGYLEGLRGIAALQVVLDHFLLAYAYHFAKFTMPGFLLANGGVDVDIFFLLSGVVLSYSAAPAPAAVGVAMARRVVRLGVPVLAGSLLAVAIGMAARGVLEAAAPLTGSPFTMARLVPLSFLRGFQDGTIYTLLGFSDTTLFGAAAPFLPTQTSVADFPIWSLHIEFWGSLLVYLLAAATRFGRRTHRVLLVLAALCIGPFPLVLFVLGHASAPLARAEARHPRLGLALIAGGIGLAAFSFIPGQYRIVDLVEPYVLLRPHSFFKLPALLAAVLLFYGVVFSPLARRLLAARPMLWLGRQSFSLYLVHAPVLFSLGAAAYLAGGMALAGPATLAGALALSVLFERLVDRPSILWSRCITGRVIHQVIHPWRRAE